MSCYDFTHTLTLSYASDVEFGACGLGPTAEQGAAFGALVEKLMFRLGERVFGRASQSRLEHATFWEAWTRAGVPCHWHSHTLVAVPQDYEAKLFVESARQWRRLTQRFIWKNGGHAEVSGTLRLKTICEENGGLKGACAYASKFSHVAPLPMMQLPEHAAA